MADEKKTGRIGRMKERLGVIGQNYRMTKEAHPSITLQLLGIIIAVLAVVIVPFSFLLNWITGLLIGLPLALLAATFWFSRKAMSAAYRQIEGQPGAAAAVVQSMRGNWSVTPAVAVTKNQDVVSRVVGRCGVVLVSEGPSNRVGHMLANERKRTGRWLPEAPIFEVQVGNEDGQVPLGRLQRELTRLPSTMRPAEVREVRRRLDALTAAQGTMPVPKGPMPTSARQVRRPRGM